MEEYQILVDEHQIVTLVEVSHGKNTVVCMRDNLFVVIELENAHHSGVCANFTVGEFHRSKFQEGHHMFHVNKHKTMYKYGPAVITLAHTEFEWLNT